jgi:membrane fusion protein (multidrug efflux system)
VNTTPLSASCASALWRAVASVAAAAVLAAFGAGCKREQPAPPPPPPDVQVAHVLQRDEPIYAEAIGQTRGSEEVEVRARVEGVLETISFQEGTRVRKGQLLYTIDPREYEARIAARQADVARSQADLTRLEQDVARYRPLAEQDAIPRQTYETAVAQANAGRAAVESYKAQLEQAKLDLSYTKIFAPIDGMIGKTEINIGNLVGRGQSTLLTQISKVDPIFLRFSLSERDYLRFMEDRKGMAARKEAAGAAATFKDAPFEMVLADGSVHLYRGTMVFADRLVDPTTGTLLLQVSFPNPEGLVRPGQYGRARTIVDFRPGAILVPQKAVSELQATYSVMVVTPDNKVEGRPVTVGPRVGTLWIIDQGLNPGDKVIVEGVQKVRPGMTVKPTVVEVTDTPSPAPLPSAPKAAVAGA